MVMASMGNVANVLNACELSTYNCPNGKLHVMLPSSSSSSSQPLKADWIPREGQAAARDAFYTTGHPMFSRIYPLLSLPKLETPAPHTLLMPPPFFMPWTVLWSTPLSTLTHSQGGFSATPGYRSSPETGRCHTVPGTSRRSADHSCVGLVSQSSLCTGCELLWRHSCRAWPPGHLGPPNHTCQQVPNSARTIWGISTSAHSNRPEPALTLEAAKCQASVMSVWRRLEGGDCEWQCS